MDRKGISKLKKFLTRMMFPIVGLSSLIWFLIRVIPKPSRATYPCMKVTAPLASSFITYLLGITVGVVAFKKARKSMYEARYVLVIMLMMIGLLAGIWMTFQMDKPIRAAVLKGDHPANSPIGDAHGIQPGRVVWIYDPDATNENCDGKFVKDGVVNDKDNFWFLAKNNNQEVIDRMVADAIRNLAGSATNSEAWEIMFKYFNHKKGKGEVGYIPGEIIFIKTNATSAWGEPGKWGMFWNDLTKTESWRPDIAETNPYVLLALLKQLVNEAGVQQVDIYVGDPMKQIYTNFYDVLHGEFPDIHYLGNDVLPNYASLDLAALGRTPVKKGDAPSLFYSDNQTVLPFGYDTLYTILEDADYMINVPTLKAHGRAGITLGAKNHFGSHTRDNAEHQHAGLISEVGYNDRPVRVGYGLYRVQVDIMGHPCMGLNTMLILVDGLFPSDEATTSPQKWNMAPFNGDWASSIFASMDQVAIESVCFDFLRTEYNGTKPETSRPNWDGVDDYLHQAADPTTWPEGIQYDPDGDGTPISSLGVHEHWNDADSKQYTRNLGTGNGIELVTIFGAQTTVRQNNIVSLSRLFILKSNYPNPFNSSTLISYELAMNSTVQLYIYNVRGEKVKSLVDERQTAGTYEIIWHAELDNEQPAPSGVYFYQIIVTDKNRSMTESKKMTLMK